MVIACQRAQRNELLQQYDLAGCHSNRKKYLTIQTMIGTPGDIRRLWGYDAEDDEMDMMPYLKSGLAKGQTQNRVSELHMQNNFLIQLSMLFTLWNAITPLHQMNTQQIASRTSRQDSLWPRLFLPD